jgi:aromatic ring-opening dioxygenase catalytic subunit (LigB family)
MASLVGVYAASHGPMIAREWDSLTPPTRASVEEGFGQVGKRMMASRPDVLVIVSPDHWVNFFLNNFPAFCVGVGAEHDGPPEPFLKKHFHHPTLAGHPALGNHIMNTAIERDFDPSLSHRLTLDHGFCLPLWRMAIDPIPPIVPIVVNEVDDPMPTMRRCLAFGALLKEAIASYPENLRVAVLATGGLSHFIGEPGMGQIDEKFDRTCISLFERGDPAALASTLENEVRHTGNGGHEVRNWVVAHATAGNKGFELIGYAPLEEVYVGCAFAEWRVAA